MAFKKSYLFAPEDQITSTFARALSHPVRLDILRTLAKNGPLNVNTLTRHYPLSKSTLSEHLEILRRDDLVRYTEAFPYIFYTLNRKMYEKMAQNLMDYFRDT